MLSWHMDSHSRQPKNLLAVSVSGMPAGWSLWRFDATGRIDPAIGAWLLEHKVYAQGQDFSGFAADDDSRQINSRLKRHWQGKEPYRMPWTHLTGWVWVDPAGTPQGVAVWEHSAPEISWLPEIPCHPCKYPRKDLAVADGGGLGLFLSAAHRGKGLMRHLMDKVIRPELQDHFDTIQRTAPDLRLLRCLSAQGATENLVASWNTKWLLCEDFRESLRRQRQIWEEAGRFHPAVGYATRPHPRPVAKKSPRPR